MFAVIHCLCFQKARGSAAELSLLPVFSLQITAKIAAPPGRRRTHDSIAPKRGATSVHVPRAGQFEALDAHLRDATFLRAIDASDFETDCGNWRKTMRRADTIGLRGLTRPPAETSSSLPKHRRHPRSVRGDDQLEGAASNDRRTDLDREFRPQFQLPDRLRRDR